MMNINKGQEKTSILLFFLISSLKTFDSGKPKSVRHSPGLPYTALWAAKVDCG
jgi:hypothetical protein